MPRINQLPSAASVAQTDVLAIDTPDKTYQVPRSVLAPAPFVVAITTGQWSGSGSDYYITVTASNVTADAMLYPFYDNASAALLNGPVWCIPAAGSFTIHTSAIPSGTVTISVLFAGILGEAQYQVLADVYSKSQVDSIVAQSTATTVFTLTPSASITDLSSVDTHCYYCAATKTVHLTIRYYSPSGKIPKANNAIAVVPASYKPSANRALGPALLTTVGGTSINGATCFETCYIDTTGTIRLNNFISGSETAYLFAISTDYMI